MGTSTAVGNRYLEGNYAPVREEVTVTDLAVTGRLPDHLDGRYLRNGPNPVQDPDPASYHWFLGSGMVHGLRIRDGRAEWYRNRFVRSADVAAALGEDTRPGPVHAGMDTAPNTNVVGHAGRTFAIVEAGGRPYELTDALDTIGPCDFDGTLPGGYTAHPHRDPATGELHAVSYHWGWGDRVEYSVLGTDGRVRRTVDVQVSGAPMMHDFALTAGRVVLLDLPVSFDLEAAAASLAGTPTFPYSWDADYPARVGVMDRESDGTDVRWFDVDPCYVFHPLNAHDDGDRVVVDVVRHDRMFDRRRLGPDEGAPTLDRWTFDLATGGTTADRIHDRGQEFPRIDERRSGLPHRYGYTVTFEDDGTGHVGFGDVLMRHDLVAGGTTSRAFGPGRTAGEFVFVPEGPDAPEDRGVLMGFVHDAASDRSDLVLVDATTLADVATVHLPVRVPNGFHGNWVPSATR